MPCARATVAATFIGPIQSKVSSRPWTGPSRFNSRCSKSRAKFVGLSIAKFNSARRARSLPLGLIRIGRSSISSSSPATRSSSTSPCSAIQGM